MKRMLCAVYHGSLGCPQCRPLCRGKHC